MKTIYAAILVMSLATGLAVAGTVNETVTFDVAKMTCATCPIAVSKAMKRVDGVEDVKVDYEQKTAEVSYNPDATSPAEIAKASADVGFPATARKLD